MKKTIITALVAIVGIAFISAPVTVKAQTATNATAPAAPSTAPKDTAGTEKKAKKEKGDFTSYKGKISAIDATSVTVTTAKGDLKLAIDDKTEYKVDKKKAAATDFAAGDEVTGSYKANADGSETAHSIHKKAAK